MHKQFTTKIQPFWNSSTGSSLAEHSLKTLILDIWKDNASLLCFARRRKLAQRPLRLDYSIHLQQRCPVQSEISCQ
jgi:hypothetical protein